MELFTNKDYIELIVISDLHLCNKLDRIDLVYKTYEYAYNNNIHYIINLGDLIDSFMPHNKDNLKIKNIYKQIDYVIDNYPLNNDIKTYILYGNHDYYQMYKHNINVSKLISNERNDLINLGYGEAYLNIFDNYIKLSHDIPYFKNYKENIETIINLIGHYHNFKINNYDNTLFIYAPSLSNLSPNNSLIIPSILDIKISFNNQIISKVNIKNMDLEKNIINSEFDICLNINNKRYIKIKEHFKSN